LLEDLTFVKNREREEQGISFLLYIFP